MNIIREMIPVIMVLLLCSVKSWAVPACPYPIEITQPDGSALTIVQKGDEFVSWIETTDGFSIVKNADGIFEYATLNGTGNVVPSGVRVREVPERTASEAAFVTSISKTSIRAKYYEAAQDKTMQLRTSKVSTTARSPVVGTKKVLCILMDFTDRPFSQAQNGFDDLMNQAGYNANSAQGSVKDYYMENSYGQLNLEITVVGPYTADYNMAYYGADILGANGNRVGDVRPQELITEAVQKADPYVDYADYDNDGDGYVDILHVIFAGYGQEAGGVTDAIWSHKWQIPEIQLDNKLISTYSCSPELKGNSGSEITTIGVVCHELGHVLGAADFYGSNSFSGSGDWDLMANGSWNGAWFLNATGSCPAHINPYQKIQFGWITPQTLTAGTPVSNMPPAATDPDVYKIMANIDDDEHYLLENRQQTGFDTWLPGHGLLIWHIAANVASSTPNYNHPQQVYPICADCITAIPDNNPISYGYNISSAGCPFPGTSGKTAFTDTSIPQAFTWEDLVGISRPITNISENNTSKTVSFTVSFDPAIIGPKTVCCNGSVFTLADQPSGVIQWEVTGPFTVSPSTGNSTTVTYTEASTSNGTLKAKVGGMEVAAKTIMPCAANINFTNQTVTTNTTITSCGDIYIENVTVTNNAKLTIETPGNIIFGGGFGCTDGATYEIMK